MSRDCISFGGHTYVVNGDVEDIIVICGEPNPIEDLDEVLDTMAVWRSKKFMLYYTGNEYDPEEMPEGGPHEFAVSGDIEAFEAKVEASGYHLNKEVKKNDITVMELVKCN
jgi:hypothetical protein